MELVLQALSPHLLALVAGAARCIPIVWLVPVFGGPSLPALIRVGLALGLSMLCYPFLLGKLDGLGAGFSGIILLKELAVGAAMGFLISLTFRAVEMAGRLTDTLRGVNMAEIIDPLSEGRTSPIGSLFLMIAAIVFLEIGGIGHLVTALGRSYEAFPVLPAPIEPNLGAKGLYLLLVSSAKMLEACVVLAAPALVALLIADVLLGIIGKAAPEIQLHFLGMPLKALVGVAMVLLSLSAIHLALTRNFQLLLTQIHSLMG